MTVPPIRIVTSAGLNAKFWMFTATARGAGEPVGLGDGLGMGEGLGEGADDGVGLGVEIADGDGLGVATGVGLGSTGIGVAGVGCRETGLGIGDEARSVGLADGVGVVVMGLAANEGVLAGDATGLSLGRITGTEPVGEPGEAVLWVWPLWPTSEIP